MSDGEVSLSVMGVCALRIGPFRRPLHFTGNTKRLFMLLAAHANTGLRRERVIEEIWPEATFTRGASALNSGVWRIRSGLTDYAGISLASVDDVVQLCVVAPARFDAASLEAAVDGIPPGHAPLAPEIRSRLAGAVAACRGEFLEGCDEHWALPLREHYTSLHIRGLIALMEDAVLGGDLELALDHGRRILELDPFREGTQRDVMRLYLRNGQRAQVIRQFRALEQRLAADLDIAPMPETVALYEEIAADPRPGARSAPLSPRPDTALRPL